jgi:hypothetical protein
MDPHPSGIHTQSEMKRTILAVTSVALFLVLLIGGARAAEPDSYPTFYTTAALKPAATPTITDAAAPETLSRSATLAPAAQATSTTGPTALQARTAFPLPPNSEVVPFSNARGTTAYHTSRSFEEVMTFYRDALAKDGAVEREVLTLMDTEGQAWFSMVFDQWKPGQGLSVVIQGVMLSPGKNVISIRLERLE